MALHTLAWSVFVYWALFGGWIIAIPRKTCYNVEVKSVDGRRRGKELPHMQSRRNGG